MKMLEFDQIVNGQFLKKFNFIDYNDLYININFCDY